MDVGHVILGWSWLYDKDVTIYGRSNMCQFEHEENKVKLVPLSLTEQSELKSAASKKTNSVSLIIAKAFSQDAEKGAPFVILATKKVTKESNTLIPPEITPVIAKFADVFHEDFSDKLPLMSDIQHPIDLISGASLSNLPHYRMNPTEHVELKRQVDKVLINGFIQDSMSPCAVLVLLTPKKMKLGVCAWIVVPLTR